MPLLKQALQVSDFIKSAFFSLRQWQSPKTSVSRLGSPYSWLWVWSSAPLHFHLWEQSLHFQCTSPIVLPVLWTSVPFSTSWINKANRNAQWLDEVTPTVLPARSAFLMVLGAQPGTAAPHSPSSLSKALDSFLSIFLVVVVKIDIIFILLCF